MKLREIVLEFCADIVEMVRRKSLKSKQVAGTTAKNQELEMTLGRVSSHWARNGMLTKRRFGSVNQNRIRARSNAGLSSIFIDAYSLFNPQELCYNEKNAAAPQWTRIFSLSACFYSLLRQEKGGSLHV